MIDRQLNMRLMLPEKGMFMSTKDEEIIRLISQAIHVLSQVTLDLLGGVEEDEFLKKYRGQYVSPGVGVRQYLQRLRLGGSLVQDRGKIFLKKEYDPRIVLRRLSETSRDFPKYLMNLNGCRRFMTFREAYVAYDPQSNGVSFGGDVLNADYSVSLMSDTDRRLISAAADTYSDLR